MSLHTERPQRQLGAVHPQPIAHALAQLHEAEKRRVFLEERLLRRGRDLNGVGESSPMPYYIQNLAEAEFAVATFMYMRLQGIAASRISIITTYNGAHPPASRARAP